VLVATYIYFFASVAAYGAATLCALAGLRPGRAAECLPVARALAVVAAGLIAVTFALRLAAWGRPPLTTTSDSLNLFVLLGTAIALGAAWPTARRGLLAYYLPALAAIAWFSAVFAPADLARPPRELSQVFLLVHVVTAFLAYALFFIASLTSVAYVHQARRLKGRRGSVPALPLPALEHLDATLYRLIRLGYPLFVLTLGMGMYWALRDADLLSQAWWLSPKIVLSAFMAAFYAASFHARSLGLLRGPKLAYLVFVGFGLLLGVYLALEFLDLTNYNFYEGPAQ
jgi:ABC-type transport system involved in cytochrome c biogenesis permease subunit